MNWKESNKNVPQKVNSLKMTKLSINSNIATSWHKIQGQENRI